MDKDGKGLLFPAISPLRRRYRVMKKILYRGMLSLFLMTAVQQGHAVAADPGYPSWMRELNAMVDQTFHIQASPSLCREPDYREQDRYFTFCLQGTGRLENVPDPFREMDTLFLAHGWKTDERYQADGHGSSSFAYEKDSCLCLISVGTDSSCDDEEEGHVPSEFWFTVSCREKDRSSEKRP